jgi:hypothetical protein
MARLHRRNHRALEAGRAEHELRGITLAVSMGSKERYDSRGRLRERTVDENPFAECTHASIIPRVLRRAREGFANALGTTTRSARRAGTDPGLLARDRAEPEALVFPLTLERLADLLE